MWFCDELKYNVKTITKKINDHKNNISVDIGSLCILIY